MSPRARERANQIKKKKEMEKKGYSPAPEAATRIRSFARRHVISAGTENETHCTTNKQTAAAGDGRFPITGRREPWPLRSASAGVLKRARLAFQDGGEERLSPFSRLCRANQPPHHRHVFGAPLRGCCSLRVLHVHFYVTYYERCALFTYDDYGLCFGRWEMRFLYAGCILFILTRE